MKPTFALFLGISLLFTTAHAALYPTNPVATTVWTGDQVVTITWVDDGTNPKIATLKEVSIDLMTGSNDAQISVKSIGTFKAPLGIAKYSVPTTLGPPGPYYFLKFTAGALEYWTTRFNIKGITGKIPGFDPNDIVANATSTTGGPTGGSSGSPSGSSTTSTSRSATSTSGTAITKTSASIAPIALSVVVLAVSYLC